VVAGIVYDRPWPLESGLLLVSTDLHCHRFLYRYEVDRGLLRLADPSWIIELPPHLAP
jgi:hypothetical protein